MQSLKPYQQEERSNKGQKAKGMLQSFLINHNRDSGELFLDLFLGEKNWRFAEIYEARLHSA